MDRGTTKLENISAMAEQIEDLFQDMKWELKEMARRYDEAMERISELESEKIWLEDLLSGREVV
jgi:Mg2+ and Co2+ transporter CorA